MRSLCLNFPNLLILQSDIRIRYSDYFSPVADATAIDRSVFTPTLVAAARRSDCAPPSATTTTAAAPVTVGFSYLRLSPLFSRWRE